MFYIHTQEVRNIFSEVSERMIIIFLEIEKLFILKNLRIIENETFIHRDQII